MRVTLRTSRTDASCAARRSRLSEAEMAQCPMHRDGDARLARAAREHAAGNGLSARSARPLLTAVRASMLSLPSLPLCVRLGETVSGGYRLDRILGAGRGGIFVGATHLPSADRVAIHFMSPRTPEGAAAHRSCIDAGSLEDGTVYVVIADVESADLRRLLSSEATPSPVDVEHGRERARQRLRRLRSSARGRPYRASRTMQPASGSLK